MSASELSGGERAELLAYAAQEKKAIRPVVLELEGRSTLADFFVIVSGRTDVHVRSIVQEIERVCKEHHLQILHQEGAESYTWVLLDLGDVIVHVFREAERAYYHLEGLWKKCPRREIPPL